MTTLIEQSKYANVIHDALLRCGWKLVWANQAVREFKRGQSLLRAWLHRTGLLAVGNERFSAHPIQHPEQIVWQAMVEEGRRQTPDPTFLCRACEWFGFHRMNLTPREFGSNR